MPVDRKLVDSIQLLNDLITKLQEDYVIPPNKFLGLTASVLENKRKEQLDRVKETYRQLNLMLQEEL